VVNRDGGQSKRGQYQRGQSQRGQLQRGQSGLWTILTWSNGTLPAVTVQENRHIKTTKVYPKEGAKSESSECVAGKSDTAESDKAKNIESDIIKNIYKEKESLETFLFNDSNKINKVAIKLIMSKWEILESKLIESVSENEKAKAKISELKMENMKLESKSKVVPIYARILDGPSSGTPKAQSMDNLKNKREVILIRPAKDDNKMSNDEIKVNVTRALDKIKNKLKVKSIRQMSRKSLVIEVDSAKDEELIKTAKLDEIGLKLEEPKKIRFSIIIYDVKKEFKPEELKKEFFWKNIDNIIY